jgi:hypothetical protein|tara:strand:- start:1285 stop:1452 length:168 start_codon:yes stop_codon:yes gene_type:complete
MATVPAARRIDIAGGGGRAREGLWAGRPDRGKTRAANRSFDANEIEIACFWYRRF